MGTIVSGSSRQLPQRYYNLPDIPRMMIFVDGENLVFRFQEMVDKGWIPREEGITHIEDTVVWHEYMSHLARECQVLRASYYTYAVGDEQRISEVVKVIDSLTHEKHRNSTLPDVMTANVFKKPRSSAQRKGVDIQLTIDVLHHVHQDNVDAVLLLSGDGDYIPLVEEIKRSGKHCFVSAFSSGLNEDLVYAADNFYCLDLSTFPEQDGGCS
jgi:uncharacterized LabA/DUF88 family protein